MSPRTSDDVRVIKKYGNRRLYDTASSRYITLEDLTVLLRRGVSVTVHDAGSGEDLTRATLTQILMEGRGAARFLSVPLLRQLIRMDNDALADFFGRYVALSLEWFERSRTLARAVAPINPLAALPFNVAEAMARSMAAVTGWNATSGATEARGPAAAAAETGATHAASAADVEALRAEIARLRERLDGPETPVTPAAPSARTGSARVPAARRRRTRGPR